MVGVHGFVRMIGRLLGGGLLMWSTGAAALPPGGDLRGFVEGANHHVGDASFVERFGRAPEAHDSEATRMHAHLAWIRAELARRPATRPELSARRAMLLGYLDEYIAKGTTPLNVDLAWRSPVFIDPLGQICAVGYLVERDAGREVAEAIAATHRFDYLEDIARAMPVVADWIDASGFTLDELASIQPGYEHPRIDNWELIRTTPDGGGLTRGKGHWQSRYGSGVLLAEGDFSRGHPSGRWRFYHASGNLAAEGSFRAGVRHGAWRFFDDTPAHTLVSAGAFAGGSYVGRWKHYDRGGAEVARTYDVPADAMSFGEHVVDYTSPSDPGVRTRIHVGDVAGDFVRIDLVDVAGQRFAFPVMALSDTPTPRDSRGRLLIEDDDGHWLRTTCRASRSWRRAVATGDIVAAHEEVFAEEACAATEPLPAKTALILERVLRARRAPQPDAPAYRASLDAEAERAIAHMRGEVEPEPADAEADDAVDDDERQDLFEVLAADMSWYVEHGHIDRLFELVFATLPDRVLDDGFPDEPEAGDSAN